MRRVAIIASGAVAVSLGLGIYFWEGETDSPVYQAATIGRGDITATITAVGTVADENAVTVLAEVAGQIDTVAVDYNSAVAAGELLATLNAEPFRSLLETALADLAVVEGAGRVADQRLIQAELRVKSEQAALASAEAELQQAKVRAEDAATSLRRMKDLAKGGDVARIDLEKASSAAATAASEVRAAEARSAAARSSLRTAEAGVQVAQNELENNRITVQSRQLAVQRMKKDLESTKIRSPILALVIERAAVPGQLVQSGELLFRLWDPNKPIILHANINEADIGRVEVGQRAYFTLAAFPDRKFEGKVVNVRKIPMNIQNVVNYSVVVEGGAAEKQVFPGMTADLTIATAQRSEVITIPLSAIRFRPQEEDLREAASRERAAYPGGEVVWVIGAGDRLRPVGVRVGITDTRFAELLEGEVAEGDQVVVGFAGAEEAFGRRWFQF